MEKNSPSPPTTLAVIIGASTFPQAPSLTAKESFRRSAEAFRQYLLSPEGLALPSDNLLSLFDSEKSAGDMDDELRHWLKTHTQKRKIQDIAARDLIVYYVGHGCFAKNGTDYAVAINRTNEDKLFHSSYVMASLAETLRQHAGALRRYLILDCCFSAQAYKDFQSAGPLEVVRQKTEAELPRRGTALLCASGPRDPAMAPDGLDYTMFPGAFINVLKQGDPKGDEFLNLATVGELVRIQIRAAHPAPAARPEVHSPEQTKGDVADVPLFPNCRLSGSSRPNLGGGDAGLAAHQLARLEAFRALLNTADAGSGFYFGAQSISSALQKRVDQWHIPASRHVLGIIDCRGWFLWMPTDRYVVFTDEGIYYTHHDKQNGFLPYSDFTNADFQLDEQSSFNGRGRDYWYVIKFAQYPIMSSGQYDRVNTLLRMLRLIRLSLTGASAL